MAAAFPGNDNNGNTALVWLRRDLRLSDHAALHHALSNHDRVLLCYIHAPEAEQPWAASGASLWWLQKSLAALQAACTEQGGALHIVAGDSQAVLAQLIAEHDISAVYWHRLYEPQTIERDTQIKASLEAAGLMVKTFPGYLLAEPWTVKTLSGGAYQVYTPFSHKMMPELPLLGMPLAVPDQAAFSKTSGFSVAGNIDVTTIPWLPRLPSSSAPWFEKLDKHWIPGEVDAHRRLTDFLENDLDNYAIARDFPAIEGTSKLAPSLHWGEISPRQVWAATQAYEAEQPGGDTEKFIKELLWRDFSQHCLYHFPELPSKPKQEKFQAMPWQSKPELITRWQRGMTGIPIVDAGLRELWQTGYMHNRVRMLVASLLTKNLNQAWQAGAVWFWDTLVDANLANNSQGWQWTAGCGVDAAPYFRIFNPATQAKKFDPEGVYLSRYVPELDSLPLQYRFAPWEAPEKVCESASFRLGEDYPKPMVDLKTSRESALARFKALSA